VHLSEGNFPANLQTMHGDLFSFCREAAQFNKALVPIRASLPVCRFVAFL
jgi:hypothetical protein